MREWPKKGRYPDLSPRARQHIRHLKILVNGVEMEIPKETNVSKLLEILQESRTSDMIVEINHRFVHAQAYDTTILEEGDRMEIIHLAMGG